MAFGLLLLLGCLALRSLQFFLCICCIVCGENTMRFLLARLTLSQMFGCGSVVPGLACMPRVSGVALVSPATVLFRCLFLCRLAFSSGVDVCHSIGILVKY